MSGTDKITVHPAAAIFPMMADDEIAELAASIKANGLANPIVLAERDGETILVDGRNRMKACEIAGVEPTYRYLNGEDLDAFVLSQNVARRHMTKSQRAMATAMVYPEAPKGGRGKRNVSVTEGFSAALLSNARAVLAYSRPLAESVIAGTLMLEAAYQQVQAATNTLTDTDRRLRAIRAARPDLAERVDAGEMSIADAEAKLVADENERREQRWAATKNMAEGMMLLDHDPSTAEAMAKEYDPDVAAGLRISVTPARFRRVAAYATALAAAMEKINGQKDTA